ncbi:34360_t:CDS:1, partial [Gigaspora margarita]
ALAIFKVAVLFAFAIMGIIIGSRNMADAFTDTFNNTISSNETLFENIRSLGNAMIKVLYAYE